MWNGPNALSFDVEDYFQTQSFRESSRSRQSRQAISRLQHGVETILQLLEQSAVRATFFVLGWEAQRNPGLIRRIADCGHEIASHGMNHTMITEQTPQQFRQDVLASKQLLEQITGRHVAGYRAPTFSITRRTLWALDVLAEEGFEYDSSIFPVRHDRYGIPTAPRGIYLATGPAGRQIVEFPPLTLRLFGQNIPAAGGGYMRLLPVAVLEWAVRRANQQGQPAVLYAHPWEFDPRQPRAKLSWSNRLRQYINLSRTGAKMRRLLQQFRFAPAAATIELYRRTHVMQRTAF